MTRRRCYCGRPINDPDSPWCAEHDDAPSLHGTVQLKVRQLWATDPTDARLILEHLGILAPGVRHVLPDPPPATLHTEPSKVPTQPDPWSSPRAQAASGKRPENCTTPAGLRDLPERNAS